MNLEEAATAHIQWKLRLLESLSGPRDQILAAEVAENATTCALGQWILGEAPRRSHLAEYQQLEREHSHFHQCAARVLRLAHAGQSDAARRAMDIHGELTHASHRLKAALRLSQQVMQPV